MAVTVQEGEAAMNIDHQPDDLIELGTPSADTRGSVVGMDDSQGGKNPWPGLSDE
jgi:hypothetical protein